MSQHKAAEPHTHFYSLSDDFSVNFFYVQNTFCYTLRTQTTHTHSVVSSHNNSTLKCVVTPISIIIIWRVVPEWRWPWQPKSSHRCKYPGSPVSSDAAGRTPNTPDAPDTHTQTTTQRLSLTEIRIYSHKTSKLSQAATPTLKRSAIISTTNSHLDNKSIFWILKPQF